MNSVYSFIRHQPSIYAFGVAFILMAISSNVFGDEPAHVETWKITEGSLILTTQGQMPDEHDLLLSTRSSEGHRRDQSSTVTLQVTADSTLDVEVIGQAYKLIGGDIHFDQPLQLKTKWLTRDLHRLLLNTNPNDRSIEFVLTDQTNENDEGIVFQTSNVRFDPERRSLIVDTDTIGLTHGLARKINDHSRDRNTIGSAVLRVSLERYVDGELIAVTNTSDTQTFDSSVAGVIGPDIIAASIPQINRYGGNYSAICEDCFEFPLPGDLADCDTATPAPCKTAFMMGTTSCNLGDQRAKWIQHTNEHPVIGQNMYRLYSNRLEQIGMAWVKHGFFALSDDYCGECLDSPGLECTDTRQPCSFDTDCNPGADCFDFTGMELGVGCSDPYSASLNSIQGGLGPRYHINAFTGDFVFPQSRPPFLPEDSFARRLQVFNDDLDPALNVGAQYFIEAQYITADDALAGNGTNNVSFRPVSIINTNVEMYMPSVTGTTRTETAAIQAWRENDSSVVETDVLIPGEGKFILAAKAWELNNGLWRYEYALQNINSDRSAGSFSVALPVGHALSNIGFHDIDYHSGEIFDPTDWFPTVLVESIVWATTPYVFDENANALRWGTLYNFRFDCNVAPQPASVTIGLFKPGSPQEVEVASIGPSIGLIDCNNNGTADVCDLNCDVQPYRYYCNQLVRSMVRSMRLRPLAD